MAYQAGDLQNIYEVSIVGSSEFVSEYIPEYICSPIQERHIPLIETGQLQPLKTFELEMLRIPACDAYNIWTLIQSELFKDGLFWVQKEPSLDAETDPVKHLVSVSTFKKVFHKPKDLNCCLTSGYDECETAVEDSAKAYAEKLVQWGKKNWKIIVILLVLLIILTAAAVTFLIIALQLVHDPPAPTSSIIDGMHVAIVRTCDYDPPCNETTGTLLNVGTSSSTVIADNFGYADKMGAFPATSSCNSNLYLSFARSILVWNAITRENHIHSNIMANVEGRFGHSMNCLNNIENGTMLLLCGGGRVPPLCEMCHMSVQTPYCLPVQPMPHNKMFHASVTVSDNQVLVIGGYDGVTNSPLQTAFSYDVTQNSWYVLPSMNMSRKGYPGAVMLDTFRVIVCGGQRDPFEFLDSCEVLNLNDTSEGWKMTEPMHEAKEAIGMVVLGDGLIRVLGGEIFYESDDTNSVELFNPKTMNWTLGLNLTEPMQPYTAVRLR